jgi:glycosyltransferase involved in cell wall biosynthesis
LKIALDATYSVGDALSGVGLYSRELLSGLAAAHPDVRFDFCYRPHRFLRAGELPPNARRRLLAGPVLGGLFHGLNQRLPRIWRGRAIATFHDLFVMTGEYSTPEFRARFAAQAREAAARADAIVAVSAFTKRQVVELLNVDAARVHVVHHGLRPLRYGAGKAARERVVLNVGAIQTRKNIGRLVEAFEALDASWRLVLAGSFGYGSESIRDRIERSPARDRIAVLGYIAPEELASWYERALIFAFPSLDEGFGMPLLEAMAAGVPIVTSTSSALPEVAGDAAILVDPRDTDALARALQCLSDDVELRRDLVRKGEARVREFSWENAVRQTWAVYQGLLGRTV